MPSTASTSLLFSLTYVSTATDLFSRQGLIDLLTVSRRNNEAAGVSGMLLYKQGNFMQVLEGPEEVVREVHRRIMRDPRHYGSITLLEGPIEQRQFGDWSMGFQDLNEDVLALPGYNEFLNTKLTSPEFLAEPSRAKKLLASFKKRM